MITALTDATIFTGEAFVEGHALLVKDGKVADIVRKVPAEAKAVSHAGKILVPGFIDAQVNGGGNVLLNNTPTAEAVLAIAAAHRAYGTLRILPTVITDTPELTAKGLWRLCARRGARIKAFSAFISRGRIWAKRGAACIKQNICGNYLMKI